jgi:hypothetical protein
MISPEWGGHWISQYSYRFLQTIYIYIIYIYIYNIYIYICGFPVEFLEQDTNWTHISLLRIGREFADEHLVTPQLPAGGKL